LRSVHHCAPLSFPTRRSSDLRVAMSDSARLSPTVDQLQTRLAEVELQLVQADEALRQGEKSRRESQDFFRKTFQTVPALMIITRSEEHTSELQSLAYLVCRLL